MPYPRLLTPLPLGPFTLPNRVIMGSMHTGAEDDGGDFESLSDFYAERAAGGVGLIITGGFAPNLEGRLQAGAGTMATEDDARRHRRLTAAVHEHGARIALQILHAGRYADHELAVCPSESQSPISRHPARELAAEEIWRTVEDFARASELARQAGYDGVEIMGSEGYLINQFLAERVNRRTDEWGATAADRRRFASEVVLAVRRALGPDLLLIYRLSLIDLVDGGQSWDDVVDVARDVQQAGADMITSGIGWHEARVPTTVTSVPRAAFSGLTARLRGEITIPIAAANRINMPQTAERVIADGEADLVAMARPFLADPLWVSKSARDAADEINTCIACNQACLDHAFDHRPVSCLVNPRAGHERELPLTKAATPKRIAVVGAGPAGLAAATTAAGRGHEVDLFDASSQIGGQFLLARQVPGKEEFAETLRYYQRQIELTGVNLRLEHAVVAADLLANPYDEIVIATGVYPRHIELPGARRHNVHSYAQVLSGEVTVGRRVAIIGAGGIGFDVAEFLTHPDEGGQPQRVEEWMAEWGVVDPGHSRGGVAEAGPVTPARQVWLLQRGAGRIGARLNRTTGWVHRLTLTRRGVQMLNNVHYEGIEDAGLRVSFGSERTDAQLIEVDDVVLCAGQESRRELADELTAAGVTFHLIGGAHVAAEIDAKRATDAGVRLALRL